MNDTNSHFSIQASNPRTLIRYDANDTTLSEAIQTVFPLETEHAIMSWNWIYVPLSYKYDLSMMIDDIIALANDVLSSPQGSRTIHWPSNTFASLWTIDWTHPNITVEAEWTSVVGDTESMLSARSKVTMGAVDFVEEWKQPLELIMGSLTSAGYGASLLGMDRLLAVVGRIGRPGILYREEHAGSGVIG